MVYAQVDSNGASVMEKSNVRQEKVSNSSSTKISQGKRQSSQKIQEKKKKATSTTAKKRRRLYTPFASAILNRLPNFEVELLSGYAKVYKNLPSSTKSKEQQKEASKSLSADPSSQGEEWFLSSFFSSRTTINGIIVFVLFLGFFLYRLKKR